MQFLKNVLSSFLGTLVGLVVFCVIAFILLVGTIGALIATSASDQKKVVVESNSVLRMDLTHAIHEKNEDNPFAMFGGGPKNVTGLTEMRDCIKHAKTDDNIKGIYLELGLANHGLATIEAIRDALIDFRKSGKFVYAYGEILSQKDYYLATAADQIFINPSGGMELKGFGAEIMYYKGMFDKLGIEVQDFHCGAFKSAIEPFIRTNMSDPNRQQLTVIYSDVYNHFISKIAEARKIDTAQLNTIVNNLEAESTAKDVDLKLIDGALYYDQVLDKMKEKLGVEKKKEVTFINLSKYASSIKKDFSTENKIAVIYAEGEIVDGNGRDGEIGGEAFAKVIRKARQDEKVKAIVLRVNSPGGSALASDVMWRELILAKKEKPLIVSFGDLAASGGYFISCMGDRIFAQPNTITGSIGVFGLIPNARKLFTDKMGITFDEVKITRHGVLGGITKPLDAEESAFAQKNVEKTYMEFKQHVAEGRGKTVEYIDSIAQGRVWTGNQGIQLGLVDEIGGLDEAIAYAAKKL